MRGLRATGVLAALALSACGGGDDDGGGDKPATGGRAGGAATVAFYDWEANVLGPRGRAEPDNAAVAESPVPQAEARRRLSRASGAVIVRAEAPGRFWALLDRPGLTGRDVASAKQEFDPLNNQPVIAIEFTETGRERFMRLTRTVARRGAPGRPAHFAIVVDRRVVSRPFIDPAQLPNGISGDNGARISGGLTVAEARRLAQRIQAAPG